MMISSVLDRVYEWLAGRMGDRFLYWCLITLCGRHGGVPSADDIGFMVGNLQAPLDAAEMERLKEACKEACLVSRPIATVAEPVEFVLSVAELIRRVDQGSRPQG